MVIRVVRAATQGSEQQSTIVFWGKALHLISSVKKIASLCTYCVLWRSITHDFYFLQMVIEQYFVSQTDSFNTISYRHWSGLGQSHYWYNILLLSKCSIFQYHVKSIACDFSCLLPCSTATVTANQNIPHFSHSADRGFKIKFYCLQTMKSNMNDWSL